MKLAFSIFKYFPYGGIQRDLMKIVRACQARGHQVKVFTLRWEAPQETDLVVEVMQIQGLHRHSQYDHFASAVLQAVIDEEFDLHIGFNKMPGLDVYYAGDSCYLEKSLTQRSTLYRLLPRFKHFHAAEAAVFSRHSRTEILMLSAAEIPRYRHHYQTPAERFHLLPPGIERDRIAPADVSSIRQSVRRELGMKPSDKLLLFVGSGFIKKGLDRALLAMAALPKDLAGEVQLVVIGRDKSEAFERLAMRLGIAARVTFFAEGRDDVPRFLFAADALVHPAYDETAGMVIIEAMLAGVPAVVTADCGYAHYLAKQEAGIVLDNPFSQARLNQALVEVLAGATREQWRRNGLDAKHNTTLFSLVPTAVDHIERAAAERRPVLVFVLFRYFPFGGLQRDFMRIALACQARGYAISVFCLSWQGEIPEGFNVIVVPGRGSVNHVRYRNFACDVQVQVKWHKPCAIIGFNKMPGLDVYYAADSCFAHKAQALRSPAYRLLPRSRHMAQFERAVFDRESDTKIMLIAPAQRPQFQQYYQTQSERMILLPPGVSGDRVRGPQWREQRASVRAEFAVGESELLILLIGSGFITKGLDRFLTAFASLPDELAARSRMLVIGQDNQQQFLRLAQSLGIEAKLTIVPGRNDIPAVLQAGDLMVHPAYMESGGMVLIEAIIAGLPVIASGACGFAHYIDTAQAGVVLPEPFSQSDLNTQLRSALQDDAQRRTWSDNGVAFGQSRTDLYNMPQHAVEYIEQCIQSTRS